MTRELALDILLNKNTFHPLYTQAFAMAVSSLDMRPCGDFIDREFLIRDLLCKADGEKDVDINWLINYIRQLPKVYPKFSEGSDTDEKNS